jgi:hypothetical protein
MMIVIFMIIVVYRLISVLLYWYNTTGWFPFNISVRMNPRGLKHAGDNRNWKLSVNHLPALTLQSARDLNVPCHQKWSKALLLTQKNRIFFKKEDVFTFRTKTQPFAGPIKSPTACADGLCFSVAFVGYTRNRSPLQGKKNHKLKKTEW